MDAVGGRQVYLVDDGVGATGMLDLGPDIPGDGADGLEGGRGA